MRPFNGVNYFLSMRSQHELWLEYKKEELTRYFKKSVTHKYGKTSRINSCCSKDLTELHQLLYFENKRIISSEVLEPLRDIGLAVWFLDGGGKTGRGRRNAYLNMTKFGLEGTAITKTYFDSLGLSCEIHENNGRIRLLFSVHGTERFLKTIAHCFPEFMFHRLK